MSIIFALHCFVCCFCDDCSLPTRLVVIRSAAVLDLPPCRIMNESFFINGLQFQSFHYQFAFYFLFFYHSRSYSWSVWKRLSQTQTKFQQTFCLWQLKATMFFFSLFYESCLFLSIIAKLHLFCYVTQLKPISAMFWVSYTIHIVSCFNHTVTTQQEKKIGTTPGLA